jgi:hypothetical protein
VFWMAHPASSDSRRQTDSDKFGVNFNRRLHPPPPQVTQ